ncbi:hypothetical protein [Aeromonas salmonicida]|uniref:hypothetical protein n=1 Tax=Aeromonas salmonicida TaxID=645 RepID=UPI000A10E7BD|nr:hypothetical protein [Aeromonas salmonicida]ELM3639898.1 hypothetical protein [Aeromonas salmonicida subsp. salmonicida]ATD40340.1 hypothetical protein BHG40_22185 [Aeromonas salmonicida subsp. masoucida]ELM3742768.1 hypothetical protein [Aeromonas salmonicida subsp. salmonicida]ORJ10466.1 hypothetical protein A7D02_19795 [Aeromonas salmonicida]ORJ15691.1 hypothetical protein A7D03_16290 [Aeromonas salmonicida]
MKGLKYFACLAKVHAKPMTRGEYNAMRGWSLPENENGQDPGYLVIHNKGALNEHQTWSPAHIFNASYEEVSQEQPDPADGEAS